jgi:predicted acyltransferase
MQIVMPSLGQEWLYRHAFTGWMTPWFGPYVPSLIFALVFVAVWWVIVRAMDRRGIYLKL